MACRQVLRTEPTTGSREDARACRSRRLAQVSFAPNDLAVGAAQLQRDGHVRVVAVAPEPAVFAGERRLDASRAVGRAAAPVVVDRLTVAMGVQVEVDPPAFG